jgi:hypothetical protein
MREVIGSLKFTAYQERYEVNLWIDGMYQDGSRAIHARLIDGEPYACLTVCIPGTALMAGEFLIKTWGENEPIARAALRSGLFVDTGLRVGTGYVEASIWRLA